MSLSAQSSSYFLKLENNEAWWGGVVVDAPQMPFGNFKYSHDLSKNLKDNQGSPILISDLGYYVWCDKAFKFEFKNDSLRAQSLLGKIKAGRSGNSLRDAYLHVCRNYFPPGNKIPDSLMFTRPQYNTWIELNYNQNENDILKYARDIIKNGFPSGVIIIDDNWQKDYGNWQFKESKFKSPKVMIDMLHKMGFKVMLWICPFVNPGTPDYKTLERDAAFLTENNGSKKVAKIKWWDGESALLDFSNPAAVKWFINKLSNLQKKLGIDGFKFDAGDPEFYKGKLAFKNDITSNEQCELYAEIGLKYTLNEYRACWKMGCQPLVQRLRDKEHSWKDLKTLIPGIISQGLMGYQFTCPDMIGGGEIGSFKNLKKVDQKLVVRWAECSALMPMMQFSVAPWRILNKENLKICREAAALHEKMGGEILKLAKECAVSGEPLVRNMEYVFPHKGYDKIKDQFMLGNNILVAPVSEENTYQRYVTFPAGKWRGDDGSIVEGPCKIMVNVPINRLPWYRKID